MHQGCPTVGLRTLGASEEFPKVIKRRWSDRGLVLNPRVRIIVHNSATIIALGLSPTSEQPPDSEDKGEMLYMNVPWVPIRCF